MADAGDLKSSGLITRAGSSPARPTKRHGLGPYLERMPAIEKQSIAGIVDTNCTPIEEITLENHPVLQAAPRD